MNSFYLTGQAGIWQGQFAHLVAAGLRHGISTRGGGVSQSPGASLNLALHTGDQIEHVRENRRRFCAAAGIDAAALVTAEQVHGERIAAVGREHCGRGAYAYDDALPATDALMTNVPGVPLMLFFADCVPVVLFDPVCQAIAVVHAGWRGSVASIAAKTLMAMCDAYGVEPARCLAAIGPSIGGCCYEVDQHVVAQLPPAVAADTRIVQPQGDRWQLDLWELNRQQLLAAGIPAAQIVVSQACTNCNAELFFSYRAEQGKTGRICAWAML